MHTERFDERWKAIDQAAATSPSGLGERALGLLDAEMADSLGVMKMVMDLKSSFPENFHFWRGNHEDVRERLFQDSNEVWETSVVREWMNERLGPDFVERYAAFEEALPLLAVGRGLVASHTPPARPLTSAEIERREQDARPCLNWTDNSQVDEQGHYVFETPAHREALEQTLASVGADAQTHWLVGHKPVHEHSGRYRSQFEGRLIQLNSPERPVVTLVGADGSFEPERDVRFL